MNVLLIIIEVLEEERNRVQTVVLTVSQGLEIEVIAGVVLLPR